ncbi:TerD family protein [Nocardioides sp.]|uniref:TerD family protein n=1 Tax=Nocardioides sp. TaxID=35761 RepID=UPI00261CF80B|nr:TerD family protein [Nocardioides sp.]
MIELSKDQETDLATEDGAHPRRLRLGIGWDKSRTGGFIGTGAPEIDLDASAIQFADGKLFDLAFYNNLSTRDGSVVHQGDNRSGSGVGDDETILVDLDKVYAKVDRIFLLVSSYAGHSLEWTDNAYCRVVTDNEAAVELARFRLTVAVKETGLVIAELVRRAPDWSLHAIGVGIPAKIPTEAVPALQRLL